jgi:hypothetical protein
MTDKEATELLYLVLRASAEEIEAAGSIMCTADRQALILGLVGKLLPPPALPALAQRMFPDCEVTISLA